jgi:hypothetical protein
MSAEENQVEEVGVQRDRAGRIQPSQEGLDGLVAELKRRIEIAYAKSHSSDPERDPGQSPDTVNEEERTRQSGAYSALADFLAFIDPTAIDAQAPAFST